MPSDRPTLAPCPVCGAPAGIRYSWHSGYRYRCSHPSCRKLGPPAPTPTEAAQEWNRAANLDPETNR